jgi:hypothetical protein
VGDQRHAQRHGRLAPRARGGVSIPFSLSLAFCSRFNLRRCTSEVPPQIPRTSWLSMASFRHWGRTLHRAQMARAALTLPP